MAPQLIAIKGPQDGYHNEWIGQRPLFLCRFHPEAKCRQGKRKIFGRSRLLYILQAIANYFVKSEPFFSFIFPHINHLFYEGNVLKGQYRTITITARVSDRPADTSCTLLFNLSIFNSVWFKLFPPCKTERMEGCSPKIFSIGHPSKLSLA
jgi:hypothetical protein